MMAPKYSDRPWYEALISEREWYQMRYENTYAILENVQARSARNLSAFRQVGGLYQADVDQYLFNGKVVA